MGSMFRRLKADEIECRVSTCNEKGVSLLLYKDARCDQNILDETVGPMNWQRSHSRDNANCTVSIWDEKKKQWISKEDTGTESFTEKEKGLASDSFKRACFNWGIGRELYTAPFIRVTADKVNLVPKAKGGGMTTFDRFDVTDIGYDEDGKVNRLSITNTKKGCVAFTMGNVSKTRKKAETAPQNDAQAMEEHYEDVRKQTIGNAKANALLSFLLENGIKTSTVLKLCKKDSLENLTEYQHRYIFDNISKIKAAQDGTQGETA